MGQKSQYQIKMKQREKRKKNRTKLAAKGEKIDEYYYGGFYLKTKAA